MDGSKHVDSFRQVNVKGSIVSTPAELVVVAEASKPFLDAALTSICKVTGVGEGQLVLVKNKDIETAIKKCEKKYPEIEGVRSGPPISWARDVVRSSILCATGEEFVRVYEALSHHESLQVVRVKNYFSNLDSTQFRRFNMTVKVSFHMKGQGIYHFAEVQIHLRPIYECKDANKELMHGN